MNGKPIPRAHTQSHTRAHVYTHSHHPWIHKLVTFTESKCFRLHRTRKINKYDVVQYTCNHSNCLCIVSELFSYESESSVSVFLSLFFLSLCLYKCEWVWVSVYSALFSRCFLLYSQSPCYSALWAVSLIVWKSQVKPHSKSSYVRVNVFVKLDTFYCFVCYFLFCLFFRVL